MKHYYSLFLNDDGMMKQWWQHTEVIVTTEREEIPPTIQTRSEEAWQAYLRGWGETTIHIIYTPLTYY